MTAVAERDSLPGQPSAPGNWVSWAGIWFLIAGFVAAQIAGLLTSLPAIVAENPSLRALLSEGGSVADVLQTENFAVGPPTLLAGLLGQWAVLLLWARMWARRGKSARQIVKTADLRSPAPQPIPCDQWMARLGLVRPTRRHVLVGVGLGIVVMLVGNGLQIAFSAAELKTSGFDATLLLNDGGLFGFALLLAIALGAPVVEEIFFRGALAGAFARRFGTGVAIAASAVLFGAAHLSGMGAGNIINAAIITGLGVVLAVARFRTGTLTVSIVAHAVVNTTAVLVFQLFGTS